MSGKHDTQEPISKEIESDFSSDELDSDDEISRNTDSGDIEKRRQSRTTESTDEISALSATKDIEKHARCAPETFRPKSSTGSLSSLESETQTRALDLFTTGSEQPSTIVALPLYMGPVWGLHEIDNDPDRQSQIESQAPSAWKLTLIMVGLCLAVFCMALDNTIIATAIPKITDEFKALADVAWYGSAYLLTTSSFQLFFGRLYTFFPVKWVFLAAVALFELGSLICGAAPSSNALIVGRAIAGLGSAGLFSGSILIIALTVPLRRRPLFVGLVASMYGIASVAGPLLGGVFTDHLTWRWCFYINLPIGAVTVLFIVFFFKSPPQPQEADRSWRALARRLDIPGTIVFVPAIICLILLLQWGGLTYAWSNIRIIFLFILFFGLLIMFAVIQVRSGDNATIPIRIIKQRSVAGAAWFSICFGGSFFILIYFVPIWFQAIKGDTAFQSGIDSLPLVLACAIFCIISGVGVTVIGYYTPFMIASSILMAVGSGMISTFAVGTGTSLWIGYQILAGAGYGLGIQNPVIVVQVELDPKDVATGTAVMIFAQTLGGALFLAVGQNVMLENIVKHVGQRFPGFDVKMILQNGVTSLDFSSAPGLKPIIQEIYNGGLNQAFYVSVALAALSTVGAIFIRWTSVKGQFLIGGG